MGFRLFSRDFFRGRFAGGAPVKSKLLQWLFASSTDSDGVVDDKANIGTDRPILSGGAKDFDGIDGVVTIPHSASLTFGNGTVDQPFSISVWVNMDDATQFRIFSKGGGTQYEYFLGGNSLDQIQLILYDATSSNKIALKTTSALTSYEGSNLFIVSTYNGGGAYTDINIYVYDDNGTLISNTGVDASGGLYTAMEAYTNSCHIGSLLEDTYGDGRIWDVRVHNTVLTSGEIQALLDNPNSLTGHEVGIWHLDENGGLVSFDSSGNEQHGTISGGVTSTTQDVVSFQNEVGYSEGRSFNGTSDYIETGVPFSPAGDYEISGWFNAPATTNNRYIFDARDGTNDGAIIYMTPTTSLIGFIHNTTQILTVSAYDDGVPHRFVASKSGSTISLSIYDVAGVLEETVSDTDATAIATTTEAVIGSRSYSTKATFWLGQLSHIKAVDGTTTIIDQLDDSGFTYTGTTLVRIPTLLDSNLTTDVFGEALQYSGVAPKNGQLVQSHCMTLDGVGDRIEIPYSSDFLFNDGSDTPFGISGYFNTGLTTGYHPIVHKGEDFWVGTSSGTSFTFNLGGDLGNYIRLGLVGAVSVSTNYFFHVYYDGTGVAGCLNIYLYDIDNDTWSIYLNGGTLSGTYTGQDNTTAIDIGYDPGSYFQGKTWDIRLHNNNPSSQSEVEAILNGGLSGNEVLHLPLAEGDGLTAFDVSGNSNHGTITGTASAIWANTQDVYHYNVANGFDENVDFNGASSYVNVNSLLTPLDSTTKGTWSAWVKPIDSTPALTEFIIDFSSSDGVGNDNLGLAINGTTGKCQASLVTNGGFHWNIFTDNKVFFDDTWTHIALVQDGVSPKLYIDGVFVDQAITIGTNYDAWFDVLASWSPDAGRIGDRILSTEDNHFDGNIRNVHFYNDDKSASEIVSIMNGSSPSTGLVAKYELDGDAVDSVGGYDGTVVGGTLKIPIVSYNEALSNPSGAFHNGAETDFKPNPLDDPKLIYQNGVDSTTIYEHTDGVVNPEFMDQRNLLKVKNYLQYYPTLTQAELDKVMDFVNGNWEPTSLGSDYLVAELDASDDTTLEIDAGTDVRLWKSLSGENDNWVVPTGWGTSEFDTYGSFTDNATSFIAVQDQAMTNIKAQTDNTFAVVAGEVWEISYIINSVDLTDGDYWFNISQGTTLNSCITVGDTSTSDLYNGKRFIQAVDSGLLVTQYASIGISHASARLAFQKQTATWGINIEVSDIKWRRISSVSMFGTNGVDPSFVSDPRSIEFNGVAEKLTTPVTSANYQGLQHFEWWGVVYMDSTNIHVPISFHDDGSDNDQWYLFSDAVNKVKIVGKDGATVNRIITDNAFSDGFHVVGVVADGTTWKIYVDAVLQAVSIEAGSNTGDFIGDFVTPSNFDVSAIGSLRVATPTYYPNKEKYQLHLKKATTEAQKQQITNYINTRFGIY